MAMTARLAATLIIVGTMAYAADLAGPAQVIDADSIVIQGREIRLDDIDAPEWDQSCILPDGGQWYPGREAAAWLKSFLDGRTIACVGQKTDAYGRIIAHCYVDGGDLSHAIVAAGWAFAYRRYSDRQIAAEDAARTAKRGVWRGSCDTPEQWRHNKSGRKVSP